ncbi:hypothetical protein CEUSTIGMA_g3065.t1 [Chlamydomonas eustigma]|uniref:Uncharacterized protein n=1 Tax=Chlamydomonas eustigma TaxID=1157962 RepID=A0A250WXS6_9CHLO|nr:hypothetical protein CEUSTIGMA_g3065.t1 [Chlamydomonas eustigma]|eukprot:GAX75621.1 hypothetical protein CEUSTIGMA_g3065.t1 [Chlamydomonas eustigma]
MVIDLNPTFHSIYPVLFIPFSLLQLMFHSFRTIIPVLVGWFYQSHPRAVADPLRSITSMTLLCLWSARLTHSYFRREEWQLGAREDWRFTDMAKICGRHWPWLSFFAAYLSQHVMLMGITWPFFTIHSSGLPWDPLWDFLATATAVTGIVIACIADTQLQSFKVRNELRKAAGLEPVLINESGLFYYSRHPNYFGELLWWWGVGLFAFRLGQPIVLCGALINTLAMIPVTIMVEERMMRKPERVEAFREYCRVTSVWVPWPRA